MEPADTKILVVEDDPAVREALERALGFEGYEIDTARDGGVALSMVRSGDYDLVLLDVMMPHVDGIEACKRIRASGDTIPILMLTAKAAVGDRVEGLDAGADDYVTKPFALDELLARIRSLLRRSMGDVSQVIKYEDLVIDPGARTVMRGEESIGLTKTEFQSGCLDIFGLCKIDIGRRRERCVHHWRIDRAGMDGVATYVVFALFAVNGDRLRHHDESRPSRTGHGRL